YVLVSADDGTKAEIFARLDDWDGNYESTSPNGGTPLSEALVDMGRYFAGEDKLGTYDVYNRKDWTGKNPQRPIDVHCRKSFVIVLTDGQPTSDLNNHHGSKFMDTIGNADGDNSENPDPWTGSQQQFVPPYESGSGSDWLDDVAHYLARTDLVRDNKLKFDQVVYTYTVGFSIDHPLLRETAANGKGRYFTTSSASKLATDLKDALLEIIDRASSLTAATVPSSRSAFGDGFYTAFFRPSADEPFWPGHLQAFRLSPDLTVLDRPRTGFPFGAPAIDPATNRFLEPRFPYWDTQEAMLSPTHPPRNLYTNLDGSSAPATFDAATISAADLGVVAGDLLLYDNDPAVPFADEEALTDALVNFYHGADVFDRDRDGDTAEKRSAVLGDIFHSNPIAIGPPPAALQGEDGFGPLDLTGSFLDRHKKRSRRIYVGANDGMLHAFHGGEFRSGDNPQTQEQEQDYYDLGTGQERMGYIPGFVRDRLKLLPQSGLGKQYFVDGNPSAADIWLPSNPGDVTKETAEWTTALVGAMRQGGRGYFALDVTEPNATSGAHFPYPRFLWEVDDSTLPLGETWSEPIITRVKLKGPGMNDNCGADDTDDGSCIERWVAVVGAGYDAAADPNSYATWVGDPNDAAWTDAGKGVFILDMKTGAVIAELRHDKNDAVLSRMKYAIPSTPGVLDLDFDGFADVIYIGDLGGQVWKWDVHEVGKDSLGNDGVVDNWPADVFFTASKTLGGQLGTNIGDVNNDGKTDYHYHSIFFPPVATYVNDQLVLGFGSGERAKLGYLGPSNKDDNNRFWVVWDRTPLRVCNALDGNGNCTAYTDPFAIEFFEGYQTVQGQQRGINDITSFTEDPAPDDDGYYIVVPDGEKFVTNHIVFAGILLTLSYVPQDITDPKRDICNSAGTTNVFLFNLERGVGLLATGRVDQLGNGAPADPRISVSRDSDGNMTVELIGQTSMGEVLKMPIPGEYPDPVELVYWRQRF
ncbi:MAG: PilC/PilY family type IV pilus protein, partial [Myxococcota bacterium]